MLFLIQLGFFHRKHCHAVELPQWVHRRPFCPNPTDINKWIEASKELNCYHNLTLNDPTKQERVYHCLPTSSLSETVEFCSRSILIRQGYCPVYSYSSEETVKPQPCTCLDSTSGCPKESFYSKEVYKFPHCLKLRDEFNCSEAVRNRTYPPENRDLDNALSTLEIAIIVISIMVTIIVVLGLVVCFLYCKRNHCETHSKCHEENQCALLRILSEKEME